MTNSLLNLPEHVLAAIFSQLTPQALAVCSLVCTAWRDLPYEYLPQKLQVCPGKRATGILEAGLRRCKNMHTISVHTISSMDKLWPRYAAALAQQRLPALRELHIQHSSNTDVSLLEQLRTILQVQGPQCCLHLALTDKASLQALLPLLPLPGLASLELNMPYLADGALQLLLHAATVQAEALHRNSYVVPGLLPAAAAQPRGVAAGAMDQLQQQQGVLRVGLWVCCWGGCPGLNLPEAAALHGKLQELPCCRMTGCESVNITSDADLQGVAQLQGLEALGICFVNDSSSNGSAKMPDRLRAMALAAGVDVGGDAEEEEAATTASDMTDDSSSSSSGNAGLGVLTTLACTLKQLNIRGSPPGGWGVAASSSTRGAPQPLLQQPQQLTPQQEQLQQHALASLTGLTKLSLQKDWAQPALPLGPIALLTLLQELALERHGLQHPSELSCLGTLTNLRVLSLVLTVTADELQDSGSWQHVGGPAHWLQRQQQEGAAAAVMERLSTLKVQDSTTVAAAMECDDSSGGASCSCCCSCHPGQLQALAGSGLGPAHAAADMLHEVLACPVLSNASSPALLDWAWLAKLQQLENAWLQVPHLDLTCLPSSLVELDAQQPRDLTRVSITCSHNRGINLPRLQHLVLPHLLQPAQQPRMQGAHAGSLQDPLEPTSMASGNKSRDDADTEADSDGDSGSGSEGAAADLQHHWEAAVLLSLALGAPELKDLELVQWQPPSAYVVAAAQSFPWLKLLSVVGPDGACDELLASVSAARAQQGLRSFNVQLQEHLVLSSFPWSSVLSAR